MKEMNGTVKQFKDMIEEMRGIYPFEDDKTYLSTHDVICRANRRLQLQTTDEKTGVIIVMEKEIEQSKIVGDQ